jgi:Leucine-rich repeat (LRR) protein
VLDLSHNSLEGVIQFGIGTLSKLTRLDLSDNALTSGIPSSLGGLANLVSLDLSGNDLRGSIPPTFGQLDQLTRLELQDNRLTFPMPAELGDMAGIRLLNLSGNELFGAIPSALGNATTLTNVQLQDNLLTGPIPSSLSQLTGLNTLDLGSNMLDALLPLSVAFLGEGVFNCSFVPGNALLYMPDVPEYRAADTNGDDHICGLPFATDEDIVEDAVEGIEDLVPDPLTGGQGNALTSKMQNAVAKADKGQYNAAINQMMAFISQLEDLVSTGTLTEEEAAPFIQQAEFLIQIWTALL